MSGLTIKALGGVVACGGIVGGGFLVKRSFFSKDESLAARLTNKKYVLLSFDSTHNDHWNNIAAAYKSQTESKDSLKINGVTISGTTENDLTSLKTACKSITEADFSQSNYNLAVKWCVVPETVKSRITKDGRKILKLDSTGAEETYHWENLMKRHNEEKVAERKFSGLSALTLGATPQTTQEAEIKKMRDKCNEIKDKKTYDSDYESSYQKTYDFCSISTSE